MEWSLGEKGILRHREVFHNMVNKTEMPTLYTIFDEFEYRVTIETRSKNKWVPYEADDIQLELRMLDPYVRVTLKHTGNGRYYAKIKAPDTYGVFKFSLDYRREGLSHLIYEDEIVIRPFRISQFERFIECAFPYYGAVFSMMIGFFIFGIIFLYTKEKEKNE
jgi:oligosaccharyltransferase complex subunit beta